MRRIAGEFLRLPLGGFEYSVQWVDDLKKEDGTECYGMQDSNDLTIQLDIDMVGDRAMCTLLHECIHAVSDEAGLRLPEAKVRALESGLYQMLKTLLPKDL